MKKVLGYLVCVLLGYNFVSANTNFLELLESKGINTQSLIDSQTVKRGVVTEMLNIVDCQDCHRPTQDMVSSLTQSWWTVFRTYPGNNFDDVSYDTSLANTNNYYCIAYVGNKGYMNGFPRSTSPVCSGKFCSDNNITNADVIQTVFNITAKIFYSQYKADWLKIGTRLSTQPTATQKYFGLEDIASIENGKKQCVSGVCAIDSTDALQTYVKYCTYEPDACGMQEFPFAKQGKRPIAEMNILVQQGIFTTDDMQNLNIEDFAKGSFILDILGRVKERAQCVDNDDIDNDGIKDYVDNCYLTFNPRQRDNDQDKIGDVCDDDLDNDTIKNPIGIVDDEGNIVFDSIKNDSTVLSEVLGLAIQQSVIKGDEYAFVAKYVGNLTDFSWSFGDGKTAKGIDATHLYTTPGVYVVHLTAKDTTGKIIEAVSTLTVLPTTQQAAALTIKQINTVGNTYNFSPITTGKLTDFVWSFGDGQTAKGESVSHTYATGGTYTVTVTAKDSTGKTITATTQIVVGGQSVSNGPARASLMPAKLVQNIGEQVSYTIVLQGVTIADVDYVRLVRGDGRTKEIRGNDIQKFIDAYATAGHYLIEGSVYLTNGTKLPLAAFITVLPNIVTKDTMDNCLFIVNTNQLDDDKNKVGNTCDIDERVGISITPRAITRNHFAFVSQSTGSLKNFVRYFGDRNTGSGESTLHTYRDDGLYTVRVEATTPKGKVLSATTTVTVGGPRAALVPAKLVQTVGEKVQYTLQLTNLKLSDIDYLDIQRGDGRTRQIRGQDIVKFVDAYNTYGGYGIGGTVYLNDNSTLAVGTYVTVVGQYYCLGNTAGNRGGACDMDKDTIPDICDTDIDGDGVVNPLGLIRFQTPTCTYDGTNVNTSVMTSLSGNSQNHIDNCPFTSNPDQAPCAALIKDTDGDGILDINDVCPAIAELFNGIEDTDGCPEYNFIVSFPSTKIQPGSCNVCPCQYAQNDSALAPGDRVKAVLYDNFTQKPVAESTRYIVP